MHSICHTLLDIAAVVLYFRRQKKNKNKIKQNKTDHATPFLFYFNRFNHPLKNKIQPQSGKTEKNLVLPLQFLTTASANPYSFLHFFTLFYTIPVFFSKNMYAHPPVYALPQNAPG